MSDEPDIPADRIRAAYATPSPDDVERAWRRVVSTPPSRSVVPWIRASLAATLLLSAGFGAGWMAGRRVPPAPTVVALGDGTSLSVRTPELVTAASLLEVP